MPGFDYDVIVIGGGAAGMVASKLAAGLGKKAALIEHRMLGGECTHYGCVPSKALIKAANIYHYTKETGGTKYGLLAKQGAAMDPANVMGHVRAVVQRVYDGHPPAVFENRGIDVIFGNPAFTDSHHVDIGGRILWAGSFIISTGSSALIPPIEGINTVPYLTNESLFGMPILPKSMIILGGGPIGTELSQALNRLNVDITIVEMGEQILIREDKELRDLLAAKLEAEGVKIRAKTRAVGLSRGQGAISLSVEYSNKEAGVISADSVLVAVGRKANVEGLKLENAGVEYSPRGIKVNDSLRTSAPNIYACGDVVGPYQFSHMAEYQARIATRNALLPFKKKASYEQYIWCMFTDPELAHMGLTEDEARTLHGNRLKLYKWEYRSTDRGKTDVEEMGLSKVICDERYNVIGAHILGSRAGDVIHEIQTIKTLGIPFYKLDSVIHIYPTFSDVIKQPAKLCYIDKLRANPLVRVMARLMAKSGRQKVN